MATSCGYAFRGQDSLVDPTISHHITMLSAALESIESRSAVITTQLQSSQSELAHCKTRLSDSQEALVTITVQLDESNAERQAQKREISRLMALLEASKLHASLTNEQLMSDLEDERMRAEQLRAGRDDALMQRDETWVQLQSAYCDLEALQVTLADSALYVRQLRRRIAELEAEPRQQQQQASFKHGKGQDGQQDKDQETIFSLASIKASIESAVASAASEPEAERKRRIRQLQLRWHPDKNPVLREFATEVTKIINEAVNKLEAVK